MRNFNFSFNSLQLFVFETVNKNLTPKLGEQSKIPIPASLLAGACAGVSQTLLTYPLELVKTRLTIQVCPIKFPEFFFLSKKWYLEGVIWSQHEELFGKM